MFDSKLSRLAMGTHTSTKAFFSLIALFSVASCGSAIQPKPQCKAQPADYSARYELVGEKVCDCEPPSGEILHLQYYVANRNDPNGKPSVGIEPSSVSDAVALGEEAEVEVKTDKEYSFGKFSSIQPPASDICSADELNETNIDVAEVPADPAAESAAPGGHAAREARLQVEQVKVLVTPLANAIYFGADLVRTDGECSATYKVSAVFPVIHCGDDEMDPSTGKPSDKICEESEELSPDIEYVCEPSTLACVPKSNFPALKK